MRPSAMNFKRTHIKTMVSGHDLPGLTMCEEIPDGKNHNQRGDGTCNFPFGAPSNLGRLRILDQN